MKAVKYGGFAIAIILIAVVTAPYWGGCKVVYQTCKFSCDLKYLGQDGFKADVNKAACKASCAADRIKCESK